MSPPTVSVLISTLNRAAYLADALSALRQLQLDVADCAVAVCVRVDLVLRDLRGVLELGVRG